MLKYVIKFVEGEGNKLSEIILTRGKASQIRCFTDIPIKGILYILEKVYHLKTA